MHDLKACFEKILCVLKEVMGNDFSPDGNLIRPGPRPRFSDIEVIALSLMSECLSIDSENLLFAKLSGYKKEFPNLISRRQYNDRRKALFDRQEIIRESMANKLNELTDVFAVDSMPLDICKLTRMHRNKLQISSDYERPDRGFCASQNRHFYGYKLHSVCSPEGVIQALDLSKASIHDIHYMKDISYSFSNCIITGDKGYVCQPLQDELYQTSGIVLEVPTRSNQKKQKPVLYVLKRIRKRIETVFSQLCDQFMIRRNYAKSFQGFRTRILAKISGMTALQYLNKFINNRPVGHIKHALS